MCIPCATLEASSRQVHEGSDARPFRSSWHPRRQTRKDADLPRQSVRRNAYGEQPLTRNLEALSPERVLEDTRHGQPVLNEDALPPNLRYHPSTYNEYLASVYALWNVLDRSAASLDNKNTWLYGYMRKVQLEAYSKLVWKNNTTRVYCEIGMNAGHGTLAMLLANPRLQVHTFDLMAWKYSEPHAKLIRVMYPKQFHIYKGDSQKTVRKFQADVESGKTKPCDVLLIDGDHSAAGAAADLRNFAKVAACNNVLLMDDINDGPGQALDDATNSGLVLDVKKREYEEGNEDNPCVRVHHSTATKSSQKFGKQRSYFR
ncbi:hypothetical protein CYMTET_46039 [Cymbomonas tetramitiformis]|uniref:Uncharacterized protein n=1 Tax=Cymbomonas tetramitiformis TaxID=36881 RepID=A0AAE0EXP6_9CHLO|nr:hypothetical protein CYMTET_46039 [Cymbomonas tetramitiformis]